MFLNCSSSDLRQFSVPGSDLLTLPTASLILSLCGHGSIRDALNAIQRRHARVSTGDMVSVSRFVPPENFELELEFVKKGTKSEQVDAALLSTQLKRKYTNQVLTLDCWPESNIFEYHGTNYILTGPESI